MEKSEFQWGKGGEGVTKKQYIRRLPKKGGWLRHFADLQGGNGRGFGKKEVSGVFEERKVDDNPMPTMDYLTLAGGQFIK